MSMAESGYHQEEWSGRRGAHESTRADEPDPSRPTTHEALLAGAEHAAQAGSFVRDLRTGRADYSEGFRRIYAAPPDTELTYESLLDRAHPEDRELIEGSLARAERTGSPFTFEVRVMRFDGIERTIRARGRVERGPDGEPAHVIGAIQDVTEDAKERSERELLSYVVDSSDDAILTKSRDGTITSWNRGAERLYGYTAEEAVGSSISIIGSPDRAAEQSEILAKVFGGRSIDHFETERIRKGGDRIMVSLTISPVRDANGRIVSAAVIARDI